MRTTLVAIGDDDRAFREAARDMLAADPRFTVVATVGCGDRLREAAEGARPDVALVDIRMPNGGPDLVRGLLADDLAARNAGGRTHPLVVVAVSAETGVDTVRAMLQAGVSGYLSKGQLGGSLSDLVHRCASGQVVLAVPSGARALRQLVQTTS